LKSIFLHILLITTVVVGAAAILTTNNPLYRKAEPAYITYKGGSGEASSHVNLNGLNTSGRSFSGKSNSGKDDVSLAISSSRNTDDLTPIASSALTAGDKSLSGSTTYAYRRTEKKNNSSGVAGFSGNEALGLLAQRGTGSDDENKEISGTSAVLAQTTYDQAMPSDRYLAPTANKGKPAGGHPGLDPNLPIGDGVWILILLSVGYVIYKKKF